MSERYSRVFSLPKSLYIEGIPILITAGALLKDNQTGAVLTQLKLRNISSKTIKSIQIKINAFDTTGTPLKGVDAFSYLDLEVPANTEFGQQTPIYLPDPAARSFTVEILSAVTCDGGVFRPLPDAKTQVAPQAVLDTVNQVETAKAEQKMLLTQQQTARRNKQTTIILLSCIPLILAVFAVIMQYWQLYHYGPVLVGRFIGRIDFTKYLVAMILPCICIISACMMNMWKPILKTTAIISLIFIAVQIICAVYFKFNGGEFNVFDSSYNSVFVHHIGGSRILKLLEMIQPYIYHELYLPSLLSESLYFIKNVAAAIVMFLCAKIAKK